MTNLVLFPYVERICRGLGVDFYGVGNAAEQDNVKTSDFSSSSLRSFPLLYTDVTVSEFFSILHDENLFVYYAACFRFNNLFCILQSLRVYCGKKTRYRI